MVSNDNILIHLPLDEIVNRQFEDISGNGNHAIANGSCRVVYDPGMGSVLNFPGEGADFLQLPAKALDFSKGFTVAAWVQVRGEHRSWSRVFDFGVREGENCFLLAIGVNPYFEFQNYENKKLTFINTTRVPPFSYNYWVHIAVTITGDATNNASIYVNGVHSVQGNCSLPLTTNRGLNYIGKSNWSNDLNFKGMMAHFRMYGRALSETEIQWVMQADKNGLSTSNGEIPFRLDLNTLKDDNLKPVMYIENAGIGDTLQLKVKNSSGKIILFKDIVGGKPTANLYHLQLRFRKNVLSATCIAALNKNSAIDGWTYSTGFDDVEKVQWVSLMKTSSGASFALGETAIISLPGISAAAEGGARNTRIEVSYDNLVYADNSSAGPLNGYQMLHMEIQSHLGVKASPFIMGMEGSNTLLNDGQTANDLTLFIANPDRARPVKFLSSSQESTKPSKFIVRFQADSMANGVPFLNFASNAEGLSISSPVSGEKVWVVNVNAPRTLENDKPIKIKLGGFITAYPTGVGHLLIEYQNIPGYWDGVYVVQLQFSPMVERRIGDDERIGIGTNAPSNKLHVNGSTKLDGVVQLGHAYGNAWLDNDTGSRIEFTTAGTTTDGKPNVCIQEGQGLNLFGDSVRPVQVRNTNLLVTEGRVSDKTGYLMPVGSIIAYGGTNAPPGWLLCNGVDVPFGNLYSELRTVLGAGQRLPDLRDRFILGSGSEKVHKTGGEARVTLTEKEMPRHKHYGFGESNPSGLDGKGDVLGNNNYYGTDEGLDQDNYLYATTETGGGGSHNNMPPYYVLTYIIKY